MAVKRANPRVLVVMTAPVWAAIGPADSFAYPPAVGILGKATNCLSCHVSNGPWKDDDRAIIDILDKDTRRLLQRPDNSFLIEVKRGQVRTVLTVIGVRTAAEIEAPLRNAWLYVDPRTIGSSSLSKFAPGWEGRAWSGRQHGRKSLRPPFDAGRIQRRCRPPLVAWALTGSRLVSSAAADATSSAFRFTFVLLSQPMTFTAS